MQSDISALFLSPFILTSVVFTAVNPNLQKPFESSFCDWQLLFSCPCLKAKVSSFLSRLCRARGWCKDLDWIGGCWWFGIGPLRLSPAWQKPWAEGWAGLITKVNSLGSRKPLWSARPPYTSRPTIDTQRHIHVYDAHLHVWTKVENIHTSMRWCTHPRSPTEMYRKYTHTWTEPQLVSSHKKGYALQTKPSFTFSLKNLRRGFLVCVCTCKPLIT